MSHYVMSNIVELLFPLPVTMLFSTRAWRMCFSKKFWCSTVSLLFNFFLPFSDNRGQNLWYTSLFFYFPPSPLAMLLKSILFLIYTTKNMLALKKSQNRNIVWGGGGKSRCTIKFCPRLSEFLTFMYFIYCVICLWKKHMWWLKW